MEERNMNERGRKRDQQGRGKAIVKKSREKGERELKEGREKIK